MPGIQDVQNSQHKPGLSTLLKAQENQYSNGICSI